ncbi:MAG: YlzJ-like family protein [Oscillospiraceae bacterium]
MIIHSVTPSNFLIYPPDLPQLQMKAFDDGYVEGYEGEEGFVLTRVISTDPKVYLDDKFSPGNIYKQ